MKPRCPSAPRLNPPALRFSESDRCCELNVQFFLTLISRDLCGFLKEHQLRVLLVSSVEAKIKSDRSGPCWYLSMRAPHREIDVRAVTPPAEVQPIISSSMLPLIAPICRNGMCCARLG